MQGYLAGFRPPASDFLAMNLSRYLFLPNSELKYSLGIQGEVDFLIKLLQNKQTILQERERERERDVIKEKGKPYVMHVGNETNDQNEK